MNRKQVRLTTRGWVLAASSAAVIVASLLIGIPDLFIVGIAGLSLIIFCLAIFGIWTSGHSLQVSRRWARHLTRGETIEVTATVPKLPAMLQNGGTQLFDIAPRSFDLQQHFTNISRGIGELRYLITPNQVGTHQLGPLTYQISDPFNLVNIKRYTGALTRVSVWPRVTELPETGDFQTRSGPYSVPLAPALDDSTLRKYIPGDELRRIHWPTSARTGSLMIRENDSRPATNVSLLIDPKLLTHNSTREWALEHAASVGCHLLLSNYPVRILGISQTTFLEYDDVAREQLLDQIVEFADHYTAENPITSSPHQSPTAQLASQLELLPPGAKVYAILSANHGLPLRATGAKGIALLLGNTRAANEEAHQLLGAGWQATQLTALVSHAQAWAKVAGQRIAEPVR